MYTFDDNTVSDLHKDAYGSRPGEYFWAEWNNSSDDDKQHIWDKIIDNFNRSINEDAAREEAGELAFVKMLDLAAATGAQDFVQGIKWVIQAEQFDDVDLQYGADYFCYHFGMNYAAKNRYPIQQAINEILAEVV